MIAYHRFQGGTYVSDWRVSLIMTLGKLLTQAEEVLGERDKNWTILGADVGTEPFPHIFYPSTGTKQVCILLANDVATPIQAIYQLAHEVIHLLNPKGGRSASVLEEGVATWFSRTESQRVNPSYSAVVQVESYQQALELAEPLMLNPDPLRKWRSRTGRGLSDVSAQELRELYPDLSEADAAALASPFNRDLQEDS